MKRSLQRLISTEEFLIPVQPNEPGVVLFRVDGLQCQVYLNPVHMQSLHIKVTQALLPMPQQQMEMKPQYQWSSDDLQILEQFFEMKVASPPYRVQSLSGFTKMLNVPAPILRDLIQIMKLELMPELAQGLKWNVQFCLRVPPSASPIVPVGTSAIVICRLKILFFVSFFVVL
jgi:mediator of RNA polymerase II transcription subunit 14